MKKLFAMIAVATATLMTNASPVQAWDGFGDWQSFYAGGFGGANFINDRRHDDAKFKFNTGYVAGGFIGYKTCEGFRLEGEISYRHNKIKEIEIADFEISTKGHLDQWSYMVNAIYDMNIGSWDACGCWSIVPFVGVGIGYDNQKFKINEIEEESVFVKDKENGFAWQLMAGLLFPVSDCWEIGVEYRFHKGQAKRLYNNSVDAEVLFHF